MVNLCYYKTIIHFIRMKDNFSAQSGFYKKFRPTYPQALYEYVGSFVSTKNMAWDCATGNGQVAGVLAKYFDKVYASDISQAQIDNAVQKSNIEYVLCPAENTPFPDHSFDLITVGQAIHWFDFDRFFGEVRRVIKPGGIVAIWGYSQLKVNEKINLVIDKLYQDIVGAYWDFERKYVEDHYASIPFPLDNVQRKNFAIEVRWTLSHLIGYLNSWSSVQHYIRKHHKNPVDQIIHELNACWPKNEIKNVSFPVFLKLGKVY